MKRPKQQRLPPIHWRSRPLATHMPLNCRGNLRALENAPNGADWVAGGLGFEPRQAESESAVLPLDDPPRAGCRLDYASGGFKAD